MVPEVRGDSREEGKTDSREGAREVPGKKEAMKGGGGGGGGRSSLTG